MAKSQNQTPSAADRAAVARHWLVRLASGAITDAELQACKTWLAQPGNDAVFRHERALWQGLDATKAAFYSGDDETAGDVVPLQRAVRPARRIVWGAMAAAACLMLAVLGQDWLRVAVYADHVTAQGDIRHVALPDGSLAVLNTDSAIAVDFGTAERRIDLLRGEVYFDVRKELGRPFRVHAGTAVAQAVGTAFNVRREAGQLTVTVTEGTVAVGADTADIAGAILLNAGDRGSYSREAGGVLRGRVDAEAATSWRRGTVFIDRLPLEDAVAELDRYWPGHVILVGPVPPQPVSLAFTPQGARDALAGLATSRGIRLRWIGGQIAILGE